MKCWLLPLAGVLALCGAAAGPLWADVLTLKHGAQLREAEPGPELIHNRHLEAVAARGFQYWQPWGLGYEPDRLVKRSGSFSARCSSESPDQQRGLFQVVTLDQTEPRPILAEAWSRAEGVSGTPSNDYSLYLDIEYDDGTHLYAQAAPFDTGDQPWQRRQVHVVPTKPIRALNIYGLFRGRLGTVWFDDFSLRELEPPGQLGFFDRIPMITLSPKEAAPMAGPTLTTDDGLTLRFDPERGDLVTTSPGGLFLRDVAANSDLRQPRGALARRDDGSLHREAVDQELQLRLTSSYSTLGGAIRIQAEVEDLAGRDRAVTAYFVYPLDAVGWRWHDDQRTARAIEEGGKYDNLVAFGAGANGLASRWPLACVSSSEQALALAVPLDEPRLVRFGYDAESRELWAAFDLGISADTERFPSRAGFTLVLYQADPEWGFRSALARYYELFPHCFTKRNQREGIWMPFTDIATVEGWEDFGFQFKEGTGNVAFDHEHGIYSFVYVEPWSFWLSMPPEMERTSERALAYIEELAQQGRPSAQAALSSAVSDAQGRWPHRIEDHPWCSGGVFCVNPSPNAPPREPGGITQFEHEWRSIEHAFAQHPGLTGVYIDSYEMYLFANALHYDREDFRAAEIPLVFDSEGRVCQHMMFNMIEFTREVARRVWARGGMTFANAAPHSFPWSAALLDVMGTETCWAPSWGAVGQYQPEPDANLNYWRALCRHRPYLLLLNTRFEHWQPEWFERYFKRAIAYGLFPSMFSHNACDDPYWQRPELYNAHRPLFRRYIPVAKALNAAGWEPITAAHTDQPNVYLERFGRAPGPVYFTLLNHSSETQQVTLTLHLEALGLEASPKLREVLSQESLSASMAGGRAMLELVIEPEDVKVIAVGP